ncbi:MAG: hypothetical protein ACRD59_16830 [Candidatus Acidiferrales bacterium]
MSSGFNTDVQIGSQIFHVQTEDRGPAHPVIDTAVYQNGRVLLRRSSNYQHFVVSEEFNSQGLRERVEEQHRSVIDDLRSGALEAEIAAAAAPAGKGGGVQVQLMNPSSWLTGGHIFLDVELSRRADRQPQPGIQVDAFIEGAIEEERYSGTTDEQGRAKLQFALPPLGKGDLTLVIRAATPGGKDELRFAMRSRAKNSSGGAPNPKTDSTN